MKIRLSAALRVLGFVLGGMCAAVAALMLVVWIGFDADGTSTMLTHHFKERYQRTLVLREPPQLQVWPHPILLLRHVSLSEKESIDTFAQADSIRLDLSIFSLLQSHPKVTRISFDGLHVTLQRSASSTWNISNFWDAPLIEASPLPWKLQLARMSLRNLVLQVNDAQDDHSAQFRISSAEISNLDHHSQGTLRVQGRLAIHGADIGMQMQSRFMVEHDLASGSLQDASLRLEGSRGELKNVKLDLSDARLEWSHHGDLVWLAPISAEVHGMLGQNKLQMNISAQGVEWKNQLLQGSKITTTVAVDQTQGKARLALSLPQLKGTLDELDVSQAGLEWDVSYGKHASQGKLQGHLNAHVMSRQYALDDFQLKSQIHSPYFKSTTLPLDLTGHLAWSRELGLQGSIQAVAENDRLQIDPNLRSLWPLEGNLNILGQGVDVDAWLSSPISAAGWHTMCMTWPRKVDLQGRVQLTRLKVGGMQLTKLVMPYVVNQKGIRIPSFSTQLSEGKISGEFQSIPETKLLLSSGEFRDVAVDHFMNNLGVPMPLVGKVSGSFRLSTLLSADVAPLRKLEGAVRWTMPAARLKGVDLMRSLHAMRHAILTNQDAVSNSVQTEHTKLGMASSRFVFAGGMIQAENIQTRSDWLALTGMGSINLLQEQLKLNVRARLLSGITKTPAKDLTKLQSRLLQLHLEGNYLHPNVRFEAVSATRSGQRSLEIRK